ncbi:UNVERIFIED_CONTAM: hypothetical protein Scaly_2215000 [Sesamum calycinum]|uniref:CCHC-type domain-containing protein n=1 Tax=Sesamum calycinum TaxID=2727403 RepID=A0AAW2MNI3_9LAMI
MKGILIQQKVFKAIDGKYSENVSEDKKLENEEYAYSSIILNLSDSVIRKVVKQISDKNIWDKLEELYTETSLPSKLFFLEKFFRYKLDMSKNIDDNIDELTKLIQDIKLTDDKNIDDYSPIVFLNAIPKTYGDVKAAIKYGRDNVHLETVISGLKSKEIDLKISKSNQNNSEVNFVRGRTKNRNSEYKHRRHSKSRSRSRGRSNSRSKNENRNEDKKKEYRCYNHGGRGHFIKDCKKPKKNKESANLTEEVYDEVYMIFDVNFVKSVLNKKEWIVDSGCTFHMTPFRDILSNYKAERLGCVSMANEKLCAVHGLGDVCMMFENGFKLTLKNVRHVPDLAQNLISCSALEEEGLEGKWVHPNLSDLWHKRLWNISSKGLDLLHNHGILKEKMDKLSFCDDYILGKHHKGEALLTSVYLINRSPSVPLLGKLRECVWTGKDVDISSLRIFGCSAFVLQNGDKLDPRAKKCIFIAYRDGVKGYRLWLRSQPRYKVIVSRDVTFNEYEFPYLANSSKKDTESNIECTFNKMEGNSEDNQQGEKVEIEENQQ